MPWSIAVWKARASGSAPFGGMKVSPRLHEMMSTFWAMSHSMPRMMLESQPPLTSITLAMTTLAPGGHALDAHGGAGDGL